MSDYWISFRLHWDNQTSYDQRYDDLKEAIDAVANGGPVWDTNTSFVAIRSPYTLASIGAHLKSAIDVRKDHVVLRVIGYTNTAYVGSPGQDFHTFFPNALAL